MLRRMTSLQGKEDTSAVRPAKGIRVAALGMRHNANYGTTGTANTRDLAGGAVGILPDIAPHDSALGLQLAQGAVVGDIASIAVRHGDDDLLPKRIQRGAGGIGRLDPHPHRSRQESLAHIAHQRAGEQSRLTENLESVTDPYD